MSPQEREIAVLRRALNRAEGRARAAEMYSATLEERVATLRRERDILAERLRGDSLLRTVASLRGISQETLIHALSAFVDTLPAPPR